jgi:ATP adenylyltransferase/5',5'''-P-1,P-4-tetraphosphate phosphorylase II
MDMEGSNRRLIDPVMVLTEIDAVTRSALASGAMGAREAGGSRRHRHLQFVPLPFEGAGAN